jgi:adenosylhomocysteine nucleosidase
MKNILVVMALNQESQGLFEQEDIFPLYTGVGKINATYTLTKHLAESVSYDLVLNLGTAGSKNFKKGEVVHCPIFCQGDMNAKALGFGEMQTPFDVDYQKGKLHDLLSNIKDYTNVAICETSDTFQTDINPYKNALVTVYDMEAYALWKVCRKEDIPFKCFKYVSDSGNENSNVDWNESLKDSAKKLVEVYKRVSLELE